MTFAIVIDVMLAIVSTLKRFASGSLPPLNDHLALGCGLPANGISSAVDVPAFRMIFSLYACSPIVGGTANGIRQELWPGAQPRFQSWGVQFLGLGYCTEQNTDGIPSFVHAL